MNKNFVNKSSSTLHQKPNKSNKKFHSNKSKENKNRIAPKNKLRQINKSEIINNNINSNIRVKSHKKNNSNKDKIKSNINIDKINIIPNSSRNNNNLLNSEKKLNIISTSNIHQPKIKIIEQNNENISDNILPKNNVSFNSNTFIYNTNKNHISINPIKKSNNNNNKSITQYNNKFHSDINNPDFFSNKKQKYLAKTELKKISNKLNIKEGDITIPNFENLKYISLEDTNALFNAWQNFSMIYKIFEEKLMKKNNFEINKTTLELITKNAEASEQLHEQKFWILYIEYLINNNLLINEKQFLSVINEAFSYMTYSNNCTQLRIYYLQKIKKYSPMYLKDGTFDDCDETYINKLNQSTINFIQNQKGVISSNIKLKSANKKKIFKLDNNLENKKI